MAVDERLLKRLRTRLEKDDARGTTRVAIANLYLRDGQVEEAERWFLEAARYSEWCELGMMSLIWAQYACRANPNSLAARREYKRQWERQGMSGEPPPPHKDLGSD